MANRVFHRHLFGAGTVLEEHLHRVGDGALVRFQVFAAVARVFDDDHFVAQFVDDRMGGVELIFVLLGHQVTERQWYGGHVLQAVVAVGGVGQLADLGDDADRRLMGGDHDAVDVMQAIFHQRVQGHRRFAGGLRVEFGREADLEQHVFHHVSAVGLGQTERTLVLGFERQVLVGVTEQHVVKAPLRRAQYAGNAHLATQGDIRQAHATT